MRALAEPAALAAASAGPATEFVDALHDAVQAVLARTAPVLEEEGLTSCTFWTLYRLAASGTDHPGAIARRLHVSMPSVTQSVDQLEAEGLVSRHRSDADRRVVRLEITPAGRRTLARVLARIDRVLGAELDGLPRTELRSAARTLAAVAGRLRAPPAPSAGASA